MRRALAILTVVVAMSACGGGDDSGFDGALDCVGESWTTTFDYATDDEGEITPFAAMEAWTSIYESFEFTIHVVDARTGTVVVDGAEIAVMQVDELASETFVVVSASGCKGFEG